MLFSSRQTPTVRSRVVITGVGLVTPLGMGCSPNASAFRDGRTAFRPVRLFDVSRQRVQTAAEVDLPGNLPKTRLSHRQVNRLGRAARLLLLAADEAWGQAGWTSHSPLPVVLGTTSGGMSLGEAYFRQCLREPANRRLQSARVTHYQAQRQGLDLADALGFSGPVVILSNACASGANAIGHGWDLIRSGRAERVLTGGYDALSELVFSGFDSLQALSPTLCRPFDAGRDGLTLGEGSAVLALESMASAQARGATIHAEIAGYGASTDIHHLTQPHPEGVAALQSMREACASAGVEPGEIDYLNAHGTGTVLNDRAEAAAIHRWAGTGVSTLPVSSSKANIGHLLGAAGAVEAAICVLALGGQWLPPMPTLRQPDPFIAFPCVQQPATARLNFVLSNSFGFGGANATLILRRAP